MNNTKPQTELVIFCDLSVFTDEERTRHMQVSQELFAAITEIQESDAGYALRLPDEAGMILKIADFINDDRRCCAFIHFGMEVEPNSNAIWLTLKGGADVKAAIRGDIGNLIPEQIATKAGLR